MKSLAQIEKRLKIIENRNTKVEQDKAWEGSLTRKICIILLTYATLGLYMNSIHVVDPWLNAVIPTFGFFLSTLTLPYIKKLWLLYRKTE